MKSFVDLVQVKIRAGKGGDGRVSFRREKYVPRGGPDGGNGGNGGGVFLLSNNQITTLYDFTRQRNFVAEDGLSGGGGKRTGRSGEDLILNIPVGTVAYELNYESGKFSLRRIHDFVNPDEKVLVAKGGKGGRGNSTFKSSVNQAPKEYERGIVGQYLDVVLELKLVADIGIIGLPNAGKSSLLARLSHARPRVEAYPFTTLSPNLGIMIGTDGKVVLADIPGLIEGAAQGKGLGDEFLRHIERTRIIVHVIDPVAQDPLLSYHSVRRELGLYSETLLEKPEIVVINKLDLVEVRESLDSTKRSFLADGKGEPMAVSALTGEGVEDLRIKTINLHREYTRFANDLPRRNLAGPETVVFGKDDLH